METRWEDIFKHLEKAGFDVYPPATKKSECTKMYIVVRHAGTSSVLTVSSNRALFDLLVYVPKHEYSKIESYLNEVKNAMDELFPLFRPVHTIDTPFFDDDVKGWMVSIQYENYQKQRRR